LYSCLNDILVRTKHRLGVSLQHSQHTPSNRRIVAESMQRILSWYEAINQMFGKLPFYRSSAISLHNNPQLVSNLSQLKPF